MLKDYIARKSGTTSPTNNGVHQEALYTNSYKIFETFILERFIAQKSFDATSMKSIEAYANSYKTFEILNLERYIT